MDRNRKNIPSGHLIKKQIINIKTNVPKKRVKAVQDEVLDLFKRKIAPKMEQLFDKLVPSDVHIYLDKLVLNVKSLNLKQLDDLEREVISEIEKEVRKALKTKGIKPLNEQKASDDVETRTAIKRDLLTSFLEDGYYPSWADVSNASAQEIMAQMLAENPKAVIALLEKIGKRGAVQRRLIYQFEAKVVEQILTLMYEKEASEVMKQLVFLQKRMMRQYPAASARKVERLTQAAALNYILEQKTKTTRFKYEERDFNRAIIEHVQTEYEDFFAETAKGESSKVRGEYVNNYQDIDILTYFLEHGSIPMWADVDSKSSLQQIFAKLLSSRLVPLQRLVERNIENPYFVQRLIFQFPTAQIMRLLEPISSDMVDFIEESVQAFRFFSQPSERRSRSISTQEVREKVLGAVLEYAFRRKRSNFVKQTIFQEIVENIAPSLSLSAATLAEELYTASSEDNRKFSGDVSNAIQNMVQKQTASQEKQQAQYDSVRKEILTATARLAEIETLLASPATLTAEVIKQLKQERGQLTRQLNVLGKQEAVFLAKDADAQSVFLEWQAMEQQKTTAIDRRAVSKAQETLVRRMEQRLPIVLKDLEAAYAQAKTTERTLLLQRLNRELFSIVNFFEQRNQSLGSELSDIISALADAPNSKEGQRLRKLRDSLQKELTEEQTKLSQISKEQQKLAALIADLTRITIKEGEDMNEAKPEPVSSGRSKLDYLVFFLEFGAIPWWAEEYKNVPIEQIFMESLQKDSLTLRQTFGRLGRTPILWQRLVNQLSETTLTELVSRLFVRQSRIVLAQVDILERIFTAKVFKSLQSNLKEFKWSKVMEILLMQPDIGDAEFVRQLVKITAIDFNVAPSELLNFMNNVVENVAKPDFLPFLPIIAAANDDEELQEVEDELLRTVVRQKLQASGMLLSDVEKMSILQEFFATTNISAEAKRVNIDSIDKIEVLLAQQIDANIAVIRAALFEALRNPKRADFIVKNLSPSAYWQIIQTLSPSGVSIAERYFSELATALQDKKLSIERTMLLLFARENLQKVFEPKFFVTQLINYISAETNRTPLAIANEWKRKLQNTTTTSSLLLYVMATELEVIKAQEDAPETLKAQTVELNNAYNLKAQQMYPALQRDNVETKGVPDDTIPLPTLYEALQKLQKELFTVTEQLKELNPAVAILQTISARTKQAQIQAQIELLQRKEPAQLRLKLAQIQDNQTIISQLKTIQEELNTAAQMQTNLLLEEGLDIDTTPDVLLPLSEMPPAQRKSELVARIEYIADNQEETENIQTLRIELQQLIQQTRKDNDQTDLLIILHIAQTIQSAPNNSPLKVLIQDIQKELPDLPLSTDEQTQNIIAHSENLSRKISDILQTQPNIKKPLNQLTQLQISIQRQLKKQDLPTLLQDWQNAQNLQDQVMQLIEKDKSLSNNEALFDQLIELDELQITLYRQIRREQERRANDQLKTIHLNQRQLLKAVRQADTPQALTHITQQLDKAEAEEIEQIAALISATKDKAVKTDFERMQRNIQTYFKRLRTRFIWQRARIIQQQAQEQARKIQLQEEQQLILEDQRKELLKTLQLDQKEAQAQADQQKQESEAQKRQRKKLLPPPSKPVDEPLFIKNAGIVILSPYIVRYFDILKLVENKAFISIEAQYKAAHLLQYLVNKQIETPENDLILNKILCGLPVTAPVPLTADISEPELKFSESLLQGAINNWARLKTMSPDALRTTFLIRTGKIVEESDRWKLTVDKGSFDMLLRTLTWGFTFIKYPWMDKAIFVEWNYM
jgi:hypothetical protein